MKRDKRELTDRNREILHLRQSGKTYGQIATELGITRARVFYLVQRETQRTVQSQTAIV